MSHDRLPTDYEIEEWKKTFRPCNILEKLTFEKASRLSPVEIRNMYSYYDMYRLSVNLPSFTMISDRKRKITMTCLFTEHRVFTPEDFMPVFKLRKVNTNICDLPPVVAKLSSVSPQQKILKLFLPKKNREEYAGDLIECNEWMKENGDGKLLRMWHQLYQITTIWNTFIKNKLSDVKSPFKKQTQNNSR